VTPLLNELGRRHTHFKGFKPIYFNDFHATREPTQPPNLGGGTENDFNDFQDSILQVGVNVTDGQDCTLSDLFPTASDGNVMRSVVSVSLYVSTFSSAPTDP